MKILIQHARYTCNEANTMICEGEERKGGREGGREGRE